MILFDVIRIPTYEEIVQDEDISEEEKEIEKQEEFERKYNFRFEEPDPDFVSQSDLLSTFICGNECWVLQWHGG